MWCRCEVYGEEAELRTVWIGASLYQLRTWEAQAFALMSYFPFYLK